MTNTQTETTAELVAVRDIRHAMQHVWAAIENLDNGPRITAQTVHQLQKAANQLAETYSVSRLFDDEQWAATQYLLRFLPEHFIEWESTQPNCDRLRCHR